MGDPGSLGLTQVTVSATSSGTFSAQAVCPSDYQATGGGFEISNGNDKVSVLASKPIVVASGPDAGNSGWSVTANYIGTGQGNNTYTVTAYVLCATTS